MKMDDIVLLNNFAVTKMRQGYTGDAILMLNVAIEGLHAHCGVNPCHDDGLSSCALPLFDGPSSASESEAAGLLTRDNGKHNSDDNVGVVFSVGILDQEEGGTTRGGGSLNEILGFCTGLLPFYDRAFTFVNSHNLDFELLENKSSLSSMVYFNLALAHHIQGIMRGKDSEILEAFRLYRLAHSVLEKVNHIVCIEVHIVILMALVNNMGHIYASFYNHEKTCRCIDWVRRAIASSQSAALDLVDYDIFIQLQLFLPVDPRNFAPAA